MPMLNVYNAAADTNPNANHDPTTNPNPTFTFSLTLIYRKPISTHSRPMTAHIMCKQNF